MAMLSKIVNVIVCTMAFFIANKIIFYLIEELWMFFDVYGTSKWIAKSMMALRTILQLATLVAFCVFGIAPLLKQNYTQLIPFLQKKLGVQGTYLFIASVVTSLGLGAYYFKQWNKKLYGEVEIMIGISTAYFVAQSMNGKFMDLAKWSTLAGSAYVIARGLGNRSEAMISHRIELSKIGPFQKSIWRPVNEPNRPPPDNFV